MIGRSISLAKHGSFLGCRDDLSSQFLKLIKQRSTDMSENPTIKQLRNYLCDLRRTYSIYSPLDELIKEVCSLENTATDGQLRKFLSGVIRDLETNYAEVMSNILKNEKPFLSGDFGEDLNDYLWLIECSAKLSSTVILDELGIYRILRGEGQLASTDLYNYINFFVQKVIPEESSDSPFIPYYKYLSDALIYIAEEIYG